MDDERDHADGIVEALGRLPVVEALAVYTGEHAVEMLRNQRVDVVVTDLKLDGQVDGLDVLREARQHSSSTQVILITAYGTIDNCKEAIRQGAFDYLVKPLDIDQLRTLVEQAARKAAAAQARQADAEQEVGSFVFNGIKGSSPVMQGLFEVVRRVAPTNISVLIEGPSGTGKELLARAIHLNSRRSDKPFKPVNCAGLSETLLESELFGHVKGAFTGANADRKGLFEAADKGTLFLDEIGDMPMNMQAKLLRVIEDGVVLPVGSNRPVLVDVRIISATNQNLNQLIERDAFREDLYFRIRGVNVVLPPLRERAQDIPTLAEHFREEAVQETGLQVTGFTDAALGLLTSYDWPGNIRQLRNAVRTMVVMCDGDKIDVQDLPPEISPRRQLPGTSAPPARLGSISLNELEKKAIVDTLARTEGNREKAAKILGIGERTLYRKIKEYNL